tara:strand:- start:203 stop:526 length:324 start_codon:yes stop_codon:yes gene_type:complete
MDEVKTACQALLPVLAGFSEIELTLSELKVLMALKLEGDLIASRISKAIGNGNGHNQRLLSDIVGKGLIDKLSNIRTYSVGCSRYKYSLNVNGEVALKITLRKLKLI